MSNYILPPPSDEQQSIINCISNGFNVVVDSVAGSGKTTSCIHLAKSQYGESKRILLLTYNSKLKLETRDRVNALGIKNMEVHSYHAFNIKYYYPNDFTDEGITLVLQQGIHPIRPFVFDIILLDEQQDMTYLYFHFVKKILRDNGGGIMPQLCLFGDVNQNIYSFKGSDERYLTMSPTIFNGISPYEWKMCHLRTSYRITKQIQSFVNDVLLGCDRIRAIKDGSKVRYSVCNSFSSDPFNEINQYIMAGHKPEDIFVLAPSINQKGNKQSPIKKAENKLVENGIPCFVPSDDNQVIDDDIIRGKLVFSSFHQVKGLERDVVIIFNFDSSYFDYYAKDEPIYKCPNTLYVAATRAKKCLTVLHHRDNAFLPFLKNTMGLYRICNFVGGKFLKRGGNEKEKNEDDIGQKSIQTFATELTKHLSAEEMDYAMGLISHKKIQDAIIRHKVVSKVRTEGGDDLYEGVADLNGIAIPSAYEYRTSKTITILGVVVMEKKKIDPKYYDFIQEVLNKFRSGNREITIEDMLKISNMYSFINSGYKNKLEQIKSYDWLNDANIEGILCGMKKYLSPYAKYELECFDTREICGRNIVGRIDVFDIVSNIVWELKCVKMLNNEHILQLAIYSYLIEKGKWEWGGSQASLNKIGVGDIKVMCGVYGIDKGTKRKAELIEELYPKIISGKAVGSKREYRLLNILTEEIIGIAYNENIDRLVDYLVKLKYGEKLLIGDEEFIRNCSEFNSKTKYKVSKIPKVKRVVEEVDFID